MSCPFVFFASKREKDKIRWEFEGRTKGAGVISYASQKQWETCPGSDVISPVSFPHIIATNPDHTEIKEMKQMLF